MTKAIGLPNGRSCSIPTYCAAWRTLKALPPTQEVKGWEWYPVPARDILARLRAGLAERINRHLPGYGVGRKWTTEYQISQQRDARKVNEYASQRIVWPCNRLETEELQARFGWSYSSVDGLTITLASRRAAA